MRQDRHFGDKPEAAARHGPDVAAALRLVAERRSFFEAFVDPAFASMHTVVGLPATPVPEPSTLALFAAGLAGLLRTARKRGGQKV